MLPLLKSAYVAAPVDDQTLWHKCPPPFWPRRTIHGTWTGGLGQTYRRRSGGKWEYRQDPETRDDWLAKQY